LSEKLPGGRASGQLWVRGAALELDAEEGRFALGLEGLELRLGGAGNRVLFFTHRAHPGLTLFTSDHALLAAPALKAREQLAEQIRGIQRKKGGRLLLVAVLLLVLGAALGSLFLLKKPMAAAVAARVPTAVEVKLGELVASQLRATKSFVDDPGRIRELERLIAPLRPAIADAPYPFNFHLIEDESINAFALPGGVVVLHAGLLQAAESPEEVLGVLAHEIAHVTERHSLRQLVGSAGLYLVVQSLLGDTSGLLAAAADGGLGLLTLQFSRDLEREADDAGFELLLEANVDPRGMVRFFDRLAEEEEKGISLPQGLSFLSTHPASLERRQRLQERVESLPDQSWQRVDVDLAVFAAKVEAVGEAPSSASEVEVGTE
jgi:predicted Zn-dependent protease